MRSLTGETGVEGGCGSTGPALMGAGEASAAWSSILLPLRWSTDQWYQNAALQETASDELGL